VVVLVGLATLVAKDLTTHMQAHWLSAHFWLLCVLKKEQTSGCDSTSAGADFSSTSRRRKGLPRPEHQQRVTGRLFVLDPS
jgi:hypothetical protein